MMLPWNAISLFDAFTNPIVRVRRAMPFVVLIQSDRTRTGRDRVEAPIALRGDLPPLGLRLIPAVVIDGRDFGVLIPGLAAVNARALTNLIADVERCRDRTVAALDELFLGI